MELFKQAVKKYNVEPMFTENAPDSFEELMKYKGSPVLPVYSGYNNSIWGKEENLYFRFHHDLIHLNYAYDFSKQGEYKTYLGQLEDLREVGISPMQEDMLYYDIVGQREYYDKYKMFVNDQPKFINSCLIRGLEWTLNNGIY